jgi:hypothetical protein
VLAEGGRNHEPKSQAPVARRSGAQVLAAAAAPRLRPDVVKPPQHSPSSRTSCSRKSQAPVAIIGGITHPSPAAEELGLGLGVK